ncbi:MAG: SIR2 family protein [Pseudomonadota bacterium]
MAQLTVAHSSQSLDVPVSLALPVILPNISTSLDGTGFLFGSGTSYEAGYPMITGLTKSVVSGLNSSEREELDRVLDQNSLEYDESEGIPNIETIADIVISHQIQTGDQRLTQLETRFHDLILDCILSVEHPNLENHVSFFEKLKSRSFGNPCSVWIFTTNYDLLFEQSAAYAGVTIENAFCGSTTRFFNPDALSYTSGQISSSKTFQPNRDLIVKLVKLHGSISWYQDNTRFFESHPKALNSINRRAMIMPRKKKIMETLDGPYKALFSIASRIIGTKCKYLSSCGFSFSDEHINDNIILPAIKSNRCKMFILSKEKLENMNEVCKQQNVNAGYENSLCIDGRNIDGGTDLWAFSNFVKIF